MIKFLLLLKQLKYKFLECTTIGNNTNFKNLTLHMLLNSTCNAKCKFCVVRKMKSEEMAKDILYKYAKPLYSRTNVLIPTWGEYTISKYGYDYLTWLMEKYPHINLFTETNGINFNEKWQKFSIDNLVLTACSLNAINAKRYQETVWDGDGGEIAYNKTINNLKNYQKLLKENNLEVFGTRLSMVLTPENYCDIEEFVRLSLELGSPYVTFFFDYTNYQIKNSCDKEQIEKALDTLIELEHLLIGKYFIFYKLYIPFSKEDIKKREKLLGNLSQEYLQKKYHQIWELAKNRDWQKEYEKRKMLRKQNNKADISYLQEITITGSQYKLNNKPTNFCTSAWDYVFMYPNGDIKVCPWESWENILNIKKPNIYNFVKKQSVNWNMILNGLYYKIIRKKIKNNCYAGCMPNCPYKNDYYNVVYENILNKQKQ